MPAGAYKLARNGGQQALVMMTSTNTFTSTKETQTYMLCASCEDRFSRNGEAYTLSKLQVSKRDFPLRTLLRSAPNALLANDPKSSTSVYAGTEVSGLDVEQLEYFALSVFWRGALEGWPRYKPIKLDQYREELRQYLLSPAPRRLSKGVAMFLLVHADDVQIRNMLFPHSDPLDGKWIHEFRIPGLTCKLHTGHGVPGSPGISELCFLQTRNIIIAPDLPSFNNMVGPQLSKSKIKDGLMLPTPSNPTAP